MIPFWLVIGAVLVLNGDCKGSVEIPKGLLPIVLGLYAKYNQNKIKSLGLYYIKKYKKKKKFRSFINVEKAIFVLEIIDT